MADPKDRTDPNTRAARGIRKGFWAGMLGVIAIAVAAALFIASREDMSSGPGNGTVTNDNMGQRNPDPAARTPNTPERAQ